MKRILILSLKDLKLISRDKLGMFFMLAFPVLMALFFGSIMNFGPSGSNALKIAVCDRDRSPVSRRFVKNLQDNEVVDVDELPREDAVDSVRRGSHAGVIIIPPEFGMTAGVIWKDAPPIHLGLDPSRRAEAGMLEGMVMQAIGGLVMDRFQDPATLRPLIEDSRKEIQADDSVPLPTRVVLSTMMESLAGLIDSIEQVQSTADTAPGDMEQEAARGRGELRLASVTYIDVSRSPDPGSRAAILSKVRSGWDVSFPQAMVWAVMGCVAGFATLIVRENTLGTHTRLLVSPLTRSQLLAGKGVACFLCLMLVLTTMIMLAVGLGMRPRRWDLLVLSIVSTGVCFVGLMLPLSLLGRTEQAVSGTVWGICTVMAMFGGGMVPVVFMPPFIQTLSNFDPVKWAVYSMEGAIWRGFTFTEMLLPCGILTAVGTVSLVIGSWMISRRQA